jgi:Mn2+/Fe2+ NRAMP family transporter
MDLQPRYARIIGAIILIIWAIIMLLGGSYGNIIFDAVMLIILSLIIIAIICKDELKEVWKNVRS